MKTVEKKSLTKTQRLAIILSAVLVFLVVGSVILSIAIANKGEDTPESVLPDIRGELGESLYSGMPIAYERIQEGEILSMLVSRDEFVRDEQTGEDVKKTHKFDLVRWPDETSAFWLGYDDGSGSSTPILYAPPIVDAEGSFNYESLYALEGNDGYGTLTMLSYLCSAVGTVYFTERIDLPSDATAKQTLLEEYGLAGDKAEITTVSFAYKYKGADGKFEEGDERYHHIQIGLPALNGDGFYYRVDGRDCVYYTQYSTFKYAQLGFESFIKGSLIAAGLASDKSFEPLLTTNFTEWKNEMHESGNVEAGSSVIAKGNVLKPIKESATYTPESNPDGYAAVNGTDFDFNLSELAEHPDFDRIRDTLVGASVGEHSALYLTLISELYSTADTIISLGESGESSYRYEITAIEGVLDMPKASGSGVYEATAAGTAVGDAASLLRITYNYYVDGVKRNTIPRHAVLDITDALVPDSAEAALRAAAIGELQSAISFDILYTADNAYVSSESLTVSDIMAIYNQNGSAASVVGENSYVSIKYYEKIGTSVGDKQTRLISMKDIKDDPKFEGLYNVLLGKKVSKDVSLVAYQNSYYYEIMRSFVTYYIDEIEGYLTSEQIVSFRFCNESLRDPFYGESIYENLTGKYSMYGVDADVCNNVISMIGGLSESTTSSSGLSGTTVAVGLTHANMKKYGLYAYTLYFELPRGIGSETIESDVEGEESMEDYNWDHELGFTLYISEVDRATGLRYVGSDMYDIVASVDADVFGFLEYSFVDFWARRNMIMLEVGYVDKFEIELYMEDVSGSFDFDIQKKTAYVSQGQAPSSVYIEGWTPMEYFEIYVTENDIRTDSDGNGVVDANDAIIVPLMTNTELHSFALRENIPTNDEGGRTVALHALYGNRSLETSYEWLGSSNFMLAFQALQMTPYEGSVTDAERAKANEDNKLMKLTIGVDARNAKSNHYVYEFYRVTDRKVMVKTYMQTEAGVKIENTEVSDMFISTFAFKKLVISYLNLFNAKEVDGEIPYSDMVGN